MVEINYTGDALWARIERAIAKVDRRLRKVVDTLSAGDLPYAIVGGHAANFWVSTIDDSAVRTTPDIEIVGRVHL